MESRRTLLDQMRLGLRLKHLSIRMPAVFTREEVTSLLAHLSGTAHLMASLLYGAGLRLMECVRLRVKDFDFAYHHMTVREGKGAQDRVIMLPLVAAASSTLALR